MKIASFEDLEVWKISISVVQSTYEITKESIFRKDFALRDQVRRASISVSSNIAEGFERNNNNEFIHFLKIAKGSAGEIRTQLYIANVIGYVSKEQFVELNQRLITLSQKLGSFISYLERIRRKGEFVPTHKTR